MDSDIYDVIDSETGYFFARMCKNKVSGYIWNLVTIYGAAHVRDKERFLVELVHIFSSSTLPLIVGGDFNLIRRLSDCNKPRRLSKWSLLFNSVIDVYDMKEMKLLVGYLLGRISIKILCW